MADLTITAAQVTNVSAILKTGLLGATVAIGEAIYLDSADANKAKLADANGAGELHRFDGIAMTGGGAGQPFLYADNGEIVLGTSAVGSLNGMVILSSTPGKLAPHTDLATATSMVPTLAGFLNSTGKNLRISRETAGGIYTL